MARGLDATADDADTSEPRCGWLANHRLRSAADAPLMADNAKAAGACAPAGKVRITPAVEDPAVIVTDAPVAPEKRTSIAACTEAESAALSGVVNVI